MLFLPRPRNGRGFLNTKKNVRNLKGKHSHPRSHLSKVRCYNCNKLGHYARDCRNPPSKQKRKGKFHASVAAEEEEEFQKKRTRAATKEQEQQRESYLVSTLFGAITNSVDTWLVDNEASRHMIGHKKTLVNYREKKFNAKVELGDDGTYDIKGVGSTSFQLQLGNVLHVEEFLYVHGLKKNLISVAVLESKGYTVAFSKGKALMWPSNESISSTMVIGLQDGGLYKVSDEVIQALAHEMINPCKLWHKRFGHLNYDAFPGLQKMVTCMPIFHFEHDSVCRGCALGKNTKNAYPHSRRRANGILDLIHFDLCGPMTAPSMNGCLYYIIFIDDCSCKTWIYFLKTKDESYSKFQEFKNLVENQTCRHIHVFRKDNGKEFEFHKYDDLCRASGIKRELAVPYNPQQNGVAERKNKTICEAARAMIYDQDLPLSLWAEVASTAVYLQNRCPHKAL
jgi:hypothetical protein